MKDTGDKFLSLPYDVDDTVWFMDSNAAQHGTVTKVSLERTKYDRKVNDEVVRNVNNQFTYTILPARANQLKPGAVILGSISCFPSKEELLASL